MGGAIKTPRKVNGCGGGAICRSASGSQGGQQSMHNAGAFEERIKELEGDIFAFTHTTNAKQVEKLLKNVATASTPR